MNLPIEFEEKMQDLLGGKYNDYLKCYEEPRHYGLRVNTSKISPTVTARPHTGHTPPCAFVSAGVKQTPHFRCPSK